ncbi:glucose-6-phosphate isomerase [Balneicella halophila]|uniref:Glucose-6-phosphate isomerase n=1 Tax=Balneicella halophila TaxID=1537566 RepID=A0A7L4UST9_BALHA|nr:glucose-6-phosphate isomerase [Balneicella halophila]PVX52531.1 glucose-6-phosphate isomerase [Balneicella halophila]
MKKIKLDLKNVSPFVDEATVEKYAEKASDFRNDLLNGTGEGSDFLGWVELPSNTPEELVAEIEDVATHFRNTVDVLVVVGIGGSYLGAKAVIDALSHSFDMMTQENENPIILYAGQNINEDYLSELKEVLRGVTFGICVISKSGTTTEPAIAFRVLKALLEEQEGEDASNYIVAITDKEKGALRTLADQKGYKTFVIPDNVGGRYSVLTPVGLLPIACAGFDIKALIAGAKEMQKHLLLTSFESNIAMQYAAFRNALYDEGKKLEILVNYHPKLANISEWWKQLYGESEGKDGKGIFPASVNFTTDLHSMGQYIQDGERTLFETVLSVALPNQEIAIPETEEDLDNLNYLAGKRLDDVNKSAEVATTLAHVDGGVPNFRIIIPRLDAYYLGQLIYFFEFACGLSGYMLGVNPFDQPGVEAYKKNMFALLGKPGFEDETEEINKRIEE